ncbi:hypothetical protein [Kribbella turkmenica]|uniref:hypothetical protein n=1 Tax=Kribbella turkmenica TaxID=2530375 RepID=UPI00192DD41B|nr:hypothetical protein [Kribbella turkmenica]
MDEGVAERVGEGVDEGVGEATDGEAEATGGVPAGELFGSPHRAASAPMATPPTAIHTHCFATTSNLEHHR